MPVEKLTKISVNEIMEMDYQIVNPDTVISKAIGIMRKHKQYELPVVKKNGVLEGLLSYNSLVKSGSIAMNEKVETIQLNIPKLKASDSVARAAELFLSSNYRLLPVTKNKKVQGIIKRMKIIELASELETWKEVNVTELMSTHIETVKVHDKLNVARSFLRRHDIRTIPVVNENKELVGVIGIEDIISYLRPKRRAKLGAFIVEKTNFDPEVKDVMITEPYYLSPDNTIKDVIALMLDKKISSLVIVKDEKPVGIVSGFDILEYIVSAGRTEESVFVNISGLDEEDPDVMDSLFEIIEGEMKKINKIYPAKVLNIHVHTYNVEGNEIKYSVNMRLSTDKYLFITKAGDWDIFKVFSEGVEKLYAQVRKKKDKKKNHKVK